MPEPQIGDDRETRTQVLRRKLKCVSSFSAEVSWRRGQRSPNVRVILLNGHRHASASYVLANVALGGRDQRRLEPQRLVDDRTTVRCCLRRKSPYPSDSACARGKCLRAREAGCYGKEFGLT